MTALSLTPVTAVCLRGKTSRTEDNSIYIYKGDYNSQCSKTILGKCESTQKNPTKIPPHAGNIKSLEKTCSCFLW